MLILLCACEQNPQGTVEPAVPTSVIMTPASSPSVEHTPTKDILSPSAEPVPFIPDITNLDRETIANPKKDMYEDKDNIYYLNFENLYRVSKKDKSISVISTNCSFFTLYESLLFYTEAEYEEGVPDEENLSYIKKYDPVADKSTIITKLKHTVWQIAGYNNKLYYTYENPIILEDEDDFLWSDLYSINLNGTGKKKIIKDIYSFCIYKDEIYYTLRPQHEDRVSLLYKCNMNGKGKQFVWDGIGWYFEVYNNRIIRGDKYQEIKSKEIIEIEMNYDMSRFAAIGQYIAMYTGDGNAYLYNVEDGKKYQLLIDTVGTFSSLEFNATNKRLYLTAYHNDNENVSIYELVIKDGVAEFRLITQQLSSHVQK